MGKKRAKRQQEEEKIITNVTEKLKGETSGTTGAVLASALTQFANVFASGLQEWKDRQAYSNASPTLKQKYDSLLISARIQQLEEEAAAKIPQQQLQPITTTNRKKQQLQPTNSVQTNNTRTLENNNSHSDHTNNTITLANNNHHSDFSDEEVIPDTQV